MAGSERGATAADSAKNLVQRKFSRKINYKAFDALFDNEDLPQRMSERQLRGSEDPGTPGFSQADEGKEEGEKTDCTFFFSFLFGFKKKVKEDLI